DVNNAARRAMEEDAYLGNADVILSRLFLSSYDLHQFPAAKGWCDQGLHRFPSNWHFTECRLMMLTTGAESLDVARAWRLADSMVVLMPARGQPYGRLSANLSVAAVLARAGKADSARHV